MTRIDVVDNHGQFTHLERRALNDIGVDCEILENTTPPDEIDADGLVLSGGPGSAGEKETGGRCGDYLDLDVPVLGICLGMQIVAAERGGYVGPGEYGGYADVTVEITEGEDPLAGSLAPETRVWTSHADQVKDLPPGFVCTARSEVCAIEAMSDESAALYGVQWHPEVAHTEQGTEVFENFRAICER
ncbi:GMP synthase [Halobacteriales archaeon QH_8_64_26]|nr:MAG: GMP synthase [Halobacteriales archaeon QH_8_64_26]